jgi:hypothetical protein
MMRILIKCCQTAKTFHPSALLNPRTRGLTTTGSPSARFGASMKPADTLSLGQAATRGSPLARMLRSKHGVFDSSILRAKAGASSLLEGTILHLNLFSDEIFAKKI